MMNELTRWLDEEIVRMKAAAEVRVAAELREEMRRQLPCIFAKIQRALAPPAGKPTLDGIKAEVRAAIAQAFVEDRKFAAAFFLQRIADAHFRPYVFDAVVECVDPNGAVIIREAVEDVLAALKRGRAVYPEIAKPRLPRRSDISRLLRRYCIRGWKVENGRTVFKGRA
jgi:hypothetical protein